jgi:hypothetical protein
MGERMVWMWECDVCGWTWVRVPGAKPAQCPSRKCRSRRWDAGGTPPEIGPGAGVFDPQHPAMADEIAGLADRAGEVGMERLQEIAAGRVSFPDTEPPPKKPVQPERAGPCGFRGWNEVLGEFSECGLEAGHPRRSRSDPGHGNWMRAEDQG